MATTTSLFTSQNAMNSDSKKTRGFSFANLGSALHFEICNYQDLQEILNLDEALWVATTAPLATLNTDKEFVALLDTDADGRLRPEEIKDAIRYLLAHHRNYESIKEGNLTLLLEHIGTESEIGERIKTSAEKVVKRLEINSGSVSLDQVRKVKEEVLQGGLDEAGLVLLEATDDAAIKQ